MLHIIQYLAMASQSTNLHVIYKERGRETGEERKSQKQLSFLACRINRKGIYPQKWDHEITPGLFQMPRRGRTGSRRGKGTGGAFCLWGIFLKSEFYYCALWLYLQCENFLCLWARLKRSCNLHLQNCVCVFPNKITASLGKVPTEKEAAQCKF